MIIPKIVHPFKIQAFLWAFFFVCAPALAQNNGTVTNHALPIGKGANTQGYGSLLLGAGQLAIGQSSADPSAVTLTGDVTLNAAGVTAIGANKVTNTQLRQSGALALIGRSANSTGNVADIQATANSSCVFVESASTLTCAQIVAANIAANAVTNAKLATAGAYTFKCNNSGSTATPSDCDATAFTSKASPVSGDIVVIQDSAASNAYKKTTVGALASAGSVGSVNGQSGSVILYQTPQILLTLTQGTPVTTADVTAATSLYLEPYNGAQLSIYDGSANWVPLNVAASTYSLPATQTQTCTLNGTTTVTGCTDTSQMTVGEQVTGTGITGTGTIATITSSSAYTLASAASGSGAQSLTFKLPPATNYDVYGVNNSGVPKLIWSAAWSNDTTPPTRALQNGVEVASGTTTSRLLGSARTTSVAGQLEDSHTHRWLSNRYNEQPRPMWVVDPTATWTGVVSATASWRQANANTANQLDYIATTPRPIWAQSQAAVVSNVSTSVTVGIGIDSTTGQSAQLNQQASISAASTNSYQTSATYTGTPGIGHHIATWIESSWTTATQTWIGSAPPTQVSGIYGEVAN